MHAELGVGTREMALHSALAEEQRSRDGRRTLPGHGQGDDLAFPSAQRLRPRRVPPGPRPGGRAGEEGLDSVEDLIGVTQPGPVVHPGRLDKLSSIYVRGEVAAVADIHPLLVRAVDDQSRDSNLSQEVTD